MESPQPGHPPSAIAASAPSGARGRTMKAVVRDRYGSADVLDLRDVATPQVAAVPISAVTALQALRDRGRVQTGQRVLIIGASGGVGTFAVQIAKAFGANVTGVCSTAKVDLVRSIGADHVIDYAHADITDGNQRYDLVLDIGGNRPLSQLRRVLTRDGTLVIVGGEGGGRWTGGIDRQLRAMVLSPFVRQRLGTFVANENSADLDALRALIETGAVTPVIDRVLALHQVPDALRELAGGRVRGKIVIAT
jgi:NADPH:quinone reductase-like Zn-dependent oxidoreductase